MSNNCEIRDYLKKAINFFSNCIIKDEQRAELFETVESAKKASIFKTSLLGKGTFNSYTNLFNEEDFRDVGMSEEEIKDACFSVQSIPDKYRTKLAEIKSLKIIKEYEEENIYYRALAGLPPKGEEPLKTRDGKYVTDLSQNEITTIYKEEIEAMKLKYKAYNYDYLYFLGTNNVKPEHSRLARDHYIIKYNDSLLSNNYTKRLIELYYESLAYCETVLATESFYDDDLYNGFLNMVIVVMTLERFSNEIIRQGIRREFVDLQDIKDFFASYLVPFDPDIPIKYLKRIVNNMNELLKNKGTNKVIIDIINLFGFENIEVFKFYLLKDLKRDKNNKIIFSDNPEEMYELKFIEVPIDEYNLNTGFKNSNKIRDYDEVVSKDKYWGDGDQSKLKHDIINTEFNYISTKYLSINAMYNVTKLSLEVNYFFNLLNELQGKKLLESCSFSNTDIKSSGTPINIFTALSLLQSLTCYRFNYEDNILLTSTQISSLYNFNFNGKYEELLNIIKDNDYLKDYIKEISLPEGIDNKRELANFYLNNRKYKEILETAMIKSNNYSEYRTLKDIYNYNMFSSVSKDCYKKNNGEYYRYYKEYIRDKDPEAYNWLMEIIYKDQKIIIAAIECLINSLELYLDSEEFENIFNGLNNNISNYIREYIYKLIIHFKSYTVQIESINYFYIFNDKFLNTIKILDDINIENKNKIIIDNTVKDLIELININKDNLKNDNLKDELVEYIYSSINKLFNNEEINIRDLLLKYKSKNCMSAINIIDDIDINKNNIKNSIIGLIERLSKLSVQKILTDKVILNEVTEFINVIKYMVDGLYFIEDIHNDLSLVLDEKLAIVDYIINLVVNKYKSYIYLNEKINVNTSIINNESIGLLDHLVIEENIKK